MLTAGNAGQCAAGELQERREKMKKWMMAAVAAVMLLGAMAASGCGKGAEGVKADDNKVVIYSCLEDFRNDYILDKLKEKFPDYDITLQFVATGNLAAKIKSEGEATEGDIILALQAVYMEQLKDNFADLSSYDTSKYLDELVMDHHKYLIWERFSGCIMTNPKILEEKGLTEPESFEELADPKYKGLVSMPDPKTSSTGFIFYQMLVNDWGEDKALEYFDRLSENVLQFTTSGSGPVSALTQGEAAIGLGITYQPVQQINDGVKMNIRFFEEGAPYDLDGYGMIRGKEEKKAVKDVFDYLYDTLIYEDKDLYSPEQIFKEQSNTIENYPKDIPYGDMTGALDIKEKERLLGEWKY